MSNDQDTPINKTPRYLRLKQIIGSRSNPGYLPISKSTFWAMVRAGKAPRGRKLSARCTVWLEDDIIALIERTYNDEQKNK